MQTHTLASSRLVGVSVIRKAKSLDSDRLIDSAFYYTCVRSTSLNLIDLLLLTQAFWVDFKLHVYNTAAPFKTRNTRSRLLRDDDDGHSTTLDTIKTIQAAPGRWTITDSHLSPDNQRSVLFFCDMALLLSFHTA